MHLLYSSRNEGWGLLFLTVILLIPILAVLFSAATLLSRRGRLKWVALILTALLTFLEPTFLNDVDMRASKSTGVIPLVCTTMIVTRFWLLAGRRSFWPLSVIWIVLIQAVLGNLVGRVFEGMSAGRWLSQSAQVLPMIWKTLVAAFSGVKVLEGAARRHLPGPGAGGFVLLGIGAVFAGVALILSITGSLFDAIRTRTGFEQPDIYTQSIAHLIIGTVAATGAWAFVQYHSSRRQP